MNFRPWVQGKDNLLNCFLAVNMEEMLSNFNDQDKHLGLLSLGLLKPTFLNLRLYVYENT